MYVPFILDIFRIVKNEAIVDWYKNIDVKRRMVNAVDDYLYDVVKNEKHIDLTEAQRKTVIDHVVTLAENNYETFS